MSHWNEMNSKVFLYNTALLVQLKVFRKSLPLNVKSNK